MAMIVGYQRVRRLTHEEVEALPILARGSRCAFMLTRLVGLAQRAGGRAGRAKKPAGVSHQDALHQRVRSARDYGWR